MSGDLELIEDFLQGRLSKEEMEIFERKMSTDDAFARLVEKEQQLINALSDERSRNFVNTVEEIVQSTPLHSANRRRIPRIIGFAIAASLILVSGILFFLSPQTRSPEATFQRYFTAYPMLLAQRDASDNNYQDFISAYQDEDWEGVVQLAGDADIQAAYPNLIDLYQSIAHLHRGEARKAIELLQQQKDLNADLRTAYLWYQSMAFLQLRDTKQAKETLHQLVTLQPGGSWQRDAERILQELK